MATSNLAVERWVVLGGGYAGLAFASRWVHHHKTLVKRLARVPSLYLLNSSAHSDCTCELYRTLRTGHPEVFDIPRIFQGKAVEFCEARAIAIDPKLRLIKARTDKLEEISYDRLIVATGASRMERNLDGLDAILPLLNPLEPRVFQTRTNQQILELRMALQRIRWLPSRNATKLEAGRKPKESFVVVIGGGATGIEIAGEIAALRGRSSRKRVIVVERHYDALKPVLGRVAHKMLKEQLRGLGIEYFEGAGAQRIDGRHLYLDSGQTIPWDLLVLAQGSVTDKTLFQGFGDRWSDAGRMPVGRDFQIEDWARHYAIGDLADYTWGGQDLPRTAQVAAQQGVYLADRLYAELLGESVIKPFHWQNWGYLVTLGPLRGAGRLGPFSLPVLWGPAVDAAKRGARLRFDAQVSTGLRLSP